MTAKNIAEFNFSNFVRESLLLNTENNSRIWFTHLNLSNSKKNDFPDSGEIADYLFSKIKSPELDFFLLLVDRKRNEKWTITNNFVSYQELIEIKIKGLKKQKKNTLHKRGCVWKKYLNRNELQKLINRNPTTPIEAIAASKKATIIQPNKPLRLGKINIQKPWGFETWYTGVEKRGVVNVIDNNGKTELPYSLNIFKKQILNNFPEELILLKKLNPSSQEIIGDLYYEMHEKKWEVYIVTEIDKSVWPKGKAVIKAGLNPKKIFEYKNRHGKDWKIFLIKNFKKATNEYEKIRFEIDNSKKNISKQLFIQELKLRKKATNFVGDCYVQKGDVVSFPAYQIHCLQHGIKVIEFQTPHYERLIVMFGQKVVTQDSWDSEKALNKMIPSVYKPPKIEKLYKTKGILLERIVNFPNFTSDRLFLDPKMIWKEKLEKKYHILIAISGRATIENKFGENMSINIEEALIIPISMGKYNIKNNGDVPLICLKAMPK